MRVLKKVEGELDKKFEARERALKANREIVPTCARAIRLVQLRKFGQAREEAERIKRRIKEIEKMLKQYPDLRDSVLGSAYQEYAELVVYLGMVEKGRIVDPGVPAKYFLLGLGDAIGELKRYALELAAAGEHEKARSLYESLEDLYAEYAGLAYPNSIVPGLKHKQDVARKVLNDLKETLLKARIYNP